MAVVGKQKLLLVWAETAILWIRCWTTEKALINVRHGVRTRLRCLGADDVRNMRRNVEIKCRIFHQSLHFLPRNQCAVYVVSVQSSTLVKQY